MKLTEDQLQQLAANLRCPDGDDALKVGQMMQATNGNLINKTFGALNLQPGDNLLEIGPGNGSHVYRLPSDICYTGIDISQSMINQAQHANAGLDNVTFILTDGNTIPFGNASFSKVATANTIYFWESPQAYALEIARILQPGGLLSVGFIPKSTMQHIPFAKYGFTLYDAEDVTKLLASAGMEVQHIDLDTEFVTSNSGAQIEREIMVITATI